jgi:MtrB/PioB family decaheme-associated outer membrane protein
MKVGKTLLLSGSCALFLYSASTEAQEGYSIGTPFAIRGLAGDETISVEAGLGHTSADSFKFGEYTGLVDDDSFFVIGNVDALLRDDYDDEKAFYLDLSARNLGLESRELEIKFGSQGQYGVRLFYQQIPHYLIEDALTPYRGDGTNNLSLPPSYPPIGDPGAPNNPTEIVNVAPLREIDIENDRERIGVSLFWLPLENWRFDVDYRNEVRDGTKTTYGLFGVNGGNNASVALPEPIDYEVNEIDATASYAGDRFQLQARYAGSFFDQKYRSLTWANAYTGGQPSGGAWPDIPDEGRMALDPDNHSHNINLSGGYNVTQTIRVSASVGYGLMLQDEDFLPYTNNSDLTPALGLPEQSLDGEVKTWRADVGLSARPIRNLDTSVRYRFHDRDNNTPRNDYARVINDTAPQNSAVELRTNLPYSYTQHLVNTDVSYRVLDRTKISLSHEFEYMERTFAERAHTDEHTLGAKIRTQPLDHLSGWLAYAHGWRDGDSYKGNKPFLESHPLESDPNAFENIPATRKYHLANRERDEVKGAVTVTPFDTLSVTLSGIYALDDYDDSDLGLTESELISATMGVSYSPLESLTTHAFYTFDQITNDQNGREWRTDAFDPTLNWSTDSEDRSHTVGIGATWAVIPNQLDITADLVLSWARTEYDMDPGSALGSVGDFEDLKSDFRSLRIVADYKALENISLRVGYRYEFLDSEDFALDGVDPDSTSNTVTFGNDGPDYTAHVVGVSTTITF